MTLAGAPRASVICHCYDGDVRTSIQAGERESMIGLILYRLQIVRVRSERFAGLPIFILRCGSERTMPYS